MFRLLSIIFFLFQQVAVMGQGTQADYERALALPGATAGKVFRSKVESQWLPGGDSFWYRVEIEKGKWEHVLVDAVKGERRVLPGPPEGASVAIAAMEKVRASANGGEETELIFVNRTEGDVLVFWIDTEGRRKGYGSVKAGERREQRTFAGHVWLAQDVMGKTLGVWEGKAGGGEAVCQGGVKDKHRACGIQDFAGQPHRFAAMQDSPEILPMAAFFEPVAVGVRHSHQHGLTGRQAVLDACVIEAPLPKGGVLDHQKRRSAAFQAVPTVNLVLALLVAHARRHATGRHARSLVRDAPGL